MKNLDNKDDLINDSKNPKGTEKLVDLLQNILENEPPNKKFDWNSEWYSDLCDIHKLAIEEYCESCDSKKVFYGNNSIAITDNLAKEIEDRPIRIHLCDPNNVFIFKNENLEGNQYISTVTLRCAKCEEIHFYSLAFTGGKIVKIGQYPPFELKEKHTLDKYKKIQVVSKYYNELICSIKAYSQHMGIAAFVYLRRIFEHIIESEYQKLPEFTSKPNTKFDEKLKTVDRAVNIIPDELDANKSRIYSILSKGIHEYEEDECYKIYPMMKEIIILTLEKYLYEKERCNSLKGLSKFLGSYSQ